MDLFEYMRENTMKTEAPLASRLRPTTLDEVVGQQHIIGKDKLLYRAIKAVFGCLTADKQCKSQRVYDIFCFGQP